MEPFNEKKVPCNHVPARRGQQHFLWNVSSVLRENADSVKDKSAQSIEEPMTAGVAMQGKGARRQKEPINRPLASASPS
jgi:hypothetical protein